MQLLKKNWSDASNIKKTYYVAIVSVETRGKNNAWASRNQINWAKRKFDM